MQVNEIKPSLTTHGSLEFSKPGLGKPLARITSWTSGFDAFEVKYNRTIASPLWSLVLFPQQPGDPPSPDAQEFLSQVPKDFRERVKPYAFGQCMMLRYLAKYPEAEDLIVNNPKLFWLLAVAVRDSIVDDTEIPQLLRARHIAILGRIIRPASKMTLNILAKTALVSGGLTEARTIIGALGKRHICRLVAHIDRVSILLLQTLLQNPNLANPSIVRILAEESRVLALDLSDTIKDIRRMAEVLNNENPDQAISRCRSLAELNRLHDRWVDRVNRTQGIAIDGGQDEWPEDLDRPDRFARNRLELERHADTNWTFPDPPFPDSDGIQAINSIRELVAEGRLQRNCVASYAASISNGEVFVYKVLWPHRATFELIKSAKGWKIGQIKLSCNRAPGPSVERKVREWFSDNSKENADTSSGTEEQNST